MFCRTFRHCPPVVTSLVNVVSFTHGDDPVIVPHKIQVSAIFAFCPDDYKDGLPQAMYSKSAVKILLWFVLWLGREHMALVNNILWFPFCIGFVFHSSL